MAHGVDDDDDDDYDYFTPMPMPRPARRREKRSMAYPGQYRSIYVDSSEAFLVSCGHGWSILL